MKTVSGDCLMDEYKRELFFRIKDNGNNIYYSYVYLPSKTINGYRHGWIEKSIYKDTNKTHETTVAFDALLNVLHKNKHKIKFFLDCNRYLKVLRQSVSGRHSSLHWCKDCYKPFYSNLRAYESEKGEYVKGKFLDNERLSRIYLFNSDDFLCNKCLTKRR